MFERIRDQRSENQRSCRRHLVLLGPSSLFLNVLSLATWEVDRDKCSRWHHPQEYNMCVTQDQVVPSHGTLRQWAALAILAWTSIMVDVTDFGACGLHYVRNACPAMPIGLQTPNANRKGWNSYLLLIINIQRINYLHPNVQGFKNIVLRKPDGNVHLVGYKSTSHEKHPFLIVHHRQRQSWSWKINSKKQHVSSQALC